MNEWMRSRPHVSGYFWIRNFFFPDTDSVHTYPVNPTYESAIFWIRSPEWKVLNALWLLNRVDAKSDIFQPCDVTRRSPALYRKCCIQDGDLVPKFSLLITRRETGIRRPFLISLGILWCRMLLNGKALDNIDLNQMSHRYVSGV